MTGTPDIDPATTALLVVDMQYFDAHRDWGEGRTAKDLGVAHYFDEYFAQIDRITPVIAGLLAEFRARNMEVLHLRVAELTPDSRDVGYKQLVRGLVVPSDSKEAEFLETLEPEPGEIVIDKSSSGVFPATNIDRILRNLGIRTLVFTGTSTGGCIQSAVFDATDLGYRVIVVDDASADSDCSSQAASVAALAAQAVTVTDAAGLVAALAPHPPLDPAARSGVERVRPYILTKPHIPNDTDAGKPDPYGAIFGPAVPVRPSVADSALVLIDVQRLTCDPAHRPEALMPPGAGFEGFHERVPAALSRMRRLLEGCRRLGVPVFHIRTAAHFADGRDLAPKRRAALRPPLLGTPAAEIMPQVAPIPGEAVLAKPASSVFNGTGLDALLVNMGVRSVIVAGVSLDSAVEASLRSFGDRGYPSVLVPEACLASLEVERRLAGFARGIINVRSVDEVLADLEQARPAA
jgi:nicotinamidase-related amidase